MMWSKAAQATLFGIASVVIVLIAGTWAKSCADRDGERPKIPPAVQRDIDSLRITRPTHDARIDTLQLQARRDSITRVAAQRRADVAEKSALSARRMADSIAAIAQTADEWKVAHDQRQQEAQQWEQTANEKEIALQSEVAGHARTRLALAEEATRRKHLETVTVPGLEKAIARLERPCKVGPIPCPTRTVIGIVGMGVGYALGQFAPLPVPR